MSGTFFRTITVPTIQPVLYQISIRAPENAFAELMTYTFPLTPSSLRIQRDSMTSYANTQGPSLSQGVTRQFDIFGLSPPTFVIEGTTGWDFHSADGYTVTGLESMQQLQSLFQTYAQLNKQQQEAGNPQMYALEFYDFFQGNFWQVELIGQPILRQSNDRPLLSYYRFTLAGVQPVAVSTFSLIDALANTFATAAGTAITNTLNTLTNFFGGYGPTGQQ